MFYIHHSACISPQQSFGQPDLNCLHPVQQGRMNAIEPPYSGIPPAQLRRMSKVVRMGVAAAMAVVEQTPATGGIIMGTSNAGKEDAVKFLNQLIEYEEGMLTPLNFVQSTPNAVAAQVAMLTKNHGYNASHLHRGLAFEMAAIDAGMLLQEHPSQCYLLGSVDDISSYNFDEKGGWYKAGNLSNNSLYETGSVGSIPGEAAVMFLVNAIPATAMAQVMAVDSLHTGDENAAAEKLKDFLKKNLLEGETVDLLLSGENGDCRFDVFYQAAENMVGNAAGVARYKHMCGEYPTATAFAVWLGCQWLNGTPIPSHMVKRTGAASNIKNILIYNCFQLQQHAFILLRAVEK